MEVLRQILCPFCGDRIGVYEPAVMLEREGDRETSIAREPSITEVPGVLMHADCFALDNAGSARCPTGS